MLYLSDLGTEKLYRFAITLCRLGLFGFGDDKKEWTRGTPLQGLNVIDAEGDSKYIEDCFIHPSQSKLK